MTPAVVYDYSYAQAAALPAGMAEPSFRAAKVLGLQIFSAQSLHLIFYDGQSSHPVMQAHTRCINLLKLLLAMADEPNMCTLCLDTLLFIDLAEPFSLFICPSPGARS